MASPVLDTALDAGQGDPVPPSFELGPELTTADRSGVDVEDRDDKVEQSGRDVGHP